MNKKIVATFRYGGRFSRALIVVLWVLLIIMPMSMIACILGTIFWHEAFAALAVMPLGLIFPLIWFIKVDKKYSKMIDKFMKDAVLVKAIMVENIPRFSGNGYVNHFAFAIKFNYNGEPIVLNNDTTMLINQTVKNELSFVSYKELRRFTDREIDVYYSPSNNQILFFKQ